MTSATENQSNSAPQAIRLLKRRLIWVMLLRVGLISVLLGATIIVNYRSNNPFLGPSTQFLLSLIAATYICTIVYALWYSSGKAIEILARFQLGMDLLFWGCMSYTTGGIVSGFTFLFDLWIIVAAIVLGGRAAFHTALISMVILVCLAVAMYSGILKSLPDQMATTLSVKAFFYFLSVNIVALFLVATLVNSLVARLESTGLGLEVERARRAELTQLHADMIRSLTVGLATTGSSGEVFTMNPAGLGILGLGIEEIEGQDISQWLPDVQKQIKEDSISLARRQSTGINKDGTKIPVECIVAPLVRADGRRRGSMVVFSDLTEVRRLEAEVEKSKRLAALGELAASLAHEIRNPLGAVSGSFQMLTNRPDLNTEDRSLFDIISRELRRMELLVNDMLDYSRPSKMNRQPTNLKKLVEEVVQIFLMSEEASGRKLSASTPEEINLSVDKSQLRQVLWNLLRNATQATSPGDSIAVEVSKTDTEVSIEIQDTGRGITESERAHIFDPFFSTRERGLGLGLALCRRIAEEHGGSIDAIPGDDCGSVFRIILPTQIADQAG